MLSGVHELLHLVDCTKEFGSLNTINCFTFEEMNRKVCGIIHGRDLIGEEFVKVFSTGQSLAKFISNCKEETKLNEFIKKTIIFKTSNRKKSNKHKTLKVLDKIVVTNDETLLSLYKRHTKLVKNELKICEKILYSDHLYTSYNENTKRCDSCFVTKSERLGLIKHIIIDDNKVYVVAQILCKLFCPFYCVNYPETRTSTFLCDISTDYFVEDIDNIDKAVLINLKDNCYVSTYSISHLFN